MARWHVVAGWLQDDSPKVGAEIGVKEGRFIDHLLTRYPALTMYAIDPWEPQPGSNEDYLEWDWNDIYTAYRKKINGKSSRVIELREYSQTAHEKVDDKSLDFVFIDAQHDYESVVRDIALWTPKVKDGGLLAGHDYQPRFPGVISAVDELSSNVAIGADNTWGVRC